MLLRSVGGFQHHPTPLCDSLGRVHPHDEGLYRGLLPRRGPSVRSAPLACHRSSCLSLSSDFFVTFTRYFSSYSDDFLSLFLFIVTCFAMSFALWSDAAARLIPDAALLHCTRKRPTLLNCARSRLSAGCGSVFSFLCDT